MMDAREIAMTWARNKVITDEWIDDYIEREDLTYENVIAARKSRWVRDNSAKNVGTHIGYELFVCQLGNDTYRYTVITPWQMSEGLCDTNGRDDDLAIELLREVDTLMLDATETVRNERKNARNARTIADATKTTAKRAAKPKGRPKDEPRDEKQPQEEPKEAPKRGRGRPKGSKDSKPRTRRTKAEIAAETNAEEPKPARRRTSGRTKSVTPRRNRTKAQIIAEADEIVARVRREREKNGEIPVVEEKRPQKRSQDVTDSKKATKDRPKPHRDELGRVPAGDMAMYISNDTAWIPGELMRYSPKPIWSDGEREYILDGKFFVPLPENAVKAPRGMTPSTVLHWNLRNGHV